MEIKIDTKNDSPEDIRKAIELLKRIVEDDSGIGEFSTGEDVGGGMASMFGDTPILGTDSSSQKRDDESKEEEDEKIDIMTY